MLKQELLDCLHSKARWYAIHQSKKVSFQINPTLERNEDLHGAVRELQFTNDYENAKTTRSEVFGEIYGSGFPQFTIYDMTTYQLWQFVASNDWKECSSLRITEGDLLSKIIQTYTNLEERGHVVRFTTKIYERVLISKTKSCLKKNESLNNTNSSASSEASENNEDENFIEELTKITFTYYGTTVKELTRILQRDGFCDVTESDIVEQNSRVRLPSLNDVTALTPDHVTPPVKATENNLGKKSRNRMNKAKEFNLQRKNMQNHKILIDTLGKTYDPYERWWFRVRNSDTEAKNIKEVSETQSVTSFFGNSWILSNSCESSEKSYVSSIKREKPQLKVNKLASVDTWKCSCEVCNGELLIPAQDSEKYMGTQGLIAYRTRRGRAKTRAPVIENRDEKMLTFDDKVKFKTSTRKLTSSSNSPSKHWRKTQGQTSAAIFWRSVSSYTTPIWMNGNLGTKQRIVDVYTPKTPPHNENYNSFQSEKIKLEYSIEKLKIIKENRKKKSKLSDNEKEQLKNAKSQEQRTAAEEERALNAHGILYTHVTGERQPYTKLSLKTKDQKKKEEKNKDKKDKKMEEKNKGKKEKKEEEKGQDKKKKTKQPTSDKTKATKATTSKTSKKEKGKNEKHKKEEEIFPVEEEEENVVEEVKIMPPDNECQTPEDKCSDFLLSQKSEAFMASQETIGKTPKPEPCYYDNFFDGNVPKYFDVMSLLALNAFIIRKESVMTSKGFEKIESLTINRIPICKYNERRMTKEKPISTHLL